MKISPFATLATAITLAMTGVASAQDQNKPMADSNAAHNPAVKSPDKMAWAPLAKGHNSFTMGEAKARLHKAGYAHVSGLKLDNDGLWQADATRHGHPVHVAVDFKCNVAAR